MQKTVPKKNASRSCECFVNVYNNKKTHSVSPLLTPEDSDNLVLARWEQEWGWKSGSKPSANSSSRWYQTAFKAFGRSQRDYVFCSIVLLLASWAAGTARVAAEPCCVKQLAGVFTAATCRRLRSAFSFAGLPSEPLLLPDCSFSFNSAVA